jgi:hypothetical protein
VSFSGSLEDSVKVYFCSAFDSSSDSSSDPKSSLRSADLTVLSGLGCSLKKSSSDESSSSDSSKSYESRFRGA